MKITNVETIVVNMPMQLDGLVPQGPGLGVEPDARVLEQWRVS